MAGMEEAIKNLMMQRAAQGGGTPIPGSRPMQPGAQGSPMPGAGGGRINPELLRAVMAAKSGGGKGRPAPKGKAAPKKPAPKKAAPKGKAPAKKAAK